MINLEGKPMKIGAGTIADTTRLMPFRSPFARSETTGLMGAQRNDVLIFPSLGVMGHNYFLSMLTENMPDCNWHK
jgi:hypothetical protein